MYKRLSSEMADAVVSFWTLIPSIGEGYLGLAPVDSMGERHSTGSLGLVISGRAMNRTPIRSDW